jgi:hypothetical protein
MGCNEGIWLVYIIYVMNIVLAQFEAVEVVCDCFRSKA